jgi:hypothetical protein
MIVTSEQGCGAVRGRSDKQQTGFAGCSRGFGYAARPPFDRHHACHRLTDRSGKSAVAGARATASIPRLETTATTPPPRPQNTTESPRITPTGLP